MTLGAGERRSWERKYQERGGRGTLHLRNPLLGNDLNNLGSGRRAAIPAKRGANGGESRRAAEAALIQFRKSVTWLVIMPGPLHSPLPVECRFGVLLCARFQGSATVLQVPRKCRKRVGQHIISMERSSWAHQPVILAGRK